MSAKKQITKIDIDSFRKEMTFSLARTKFMELEWVNETMIDLIYKKEKKFTEAYLILRDEIYKRMNEYRKIMISHGQNMELTENKLNLNIGIKNERHSKQ